jgi:DNA-3-methyladenine glycosylase II
MHTTTVPCVPGFDLQRSLAFIDGFGPMVGEQATSATTLTKALRVRGQSVVVEVSQDRDRWLSLRTASRGPIDAETAREIGDCICFVLSADEDMTPFYERASADPVMAPIVRRLAGLHHVKFPSAFECAVWGVLNQRIGQPAARRMKTALVRRYGVGVEHGGTTHTPFPDAETIASVGEAAITQTIGNELKAKRVAAIARAFARVDPTFLREAPLDEAEAWLRAIHGVGEFTSGFVLFRGLGRFVRSPMQPGLLRAASAAYGRSMDATEVTQLAASYGRWGGHWVLYLRAASFVAMRAAA